MNKSTPGILVMTDGKLLRCAHKKNPQLEKELALATDAGCHPARGCRTAFPWEPGWRPTKGAPMGEQERRPALRWRRRSSCSAWWRSSSNTRARNTARREGVQEGKHMSAEALCTLSHHEELPVPKNNSPVLPLVPGYPRAAGVSTPSSRGTNLYR